MSEQSDLIDVEKYLRERGRLADKSRYLKILDSIPDRGQDPVASELIERGLSFSQTPGDTNGRQ